MQSHPSCIEWLVTGRCRLSCLHCCYWNLRNEEELDHKTTLQLVEEFKALEVEKITFSGGEPFLREDITEILDLTHANGICIRVDTSEGLPLRTIKHLKRLGVFVSVSLDGSAADIHDRIRGGRSFCNVTTSIRLLARYGVPHMVVTVLSRINSGDIFRIHSLLNRIGAKQWLVVPVKWWGRAQAERKKLELSPEREDYLLRQLLLLDGKGVRVESIVNKHFEPISRLKYACEPDRGVVHITPSGRVLGCPWLPQISYGGSLRREVPRRIWQKVQQLKLFRIPISRLRVCSKCEYRHICGGGCMATALRETGDILGPDPIACRRMRLISKLVFRSG